MAFGFLGVYSSIPGMAWRLKQKKLWKVIQTPYEVGD